MSAIEPATRLTLDVDQAVAFLKELPQAFPTLSASHLDATNRKAKFETKAFAPASGCEVDWLAVSSWIQARPHANIYYALNPVTAQDKKAERTDVASVVAFHADVDAYVGESQVDACERITAALRKYDPAPSAIVFSGGGCQALWFLSEPILIDGDLARAEDTKLFNVQIERDLGGDNTHNIDRILRLPGTANWPDAKKIKKGRVPMLAELVEMNGARHAVAKFKKAKAEPGGNAPNASVNVPATVNRLRSLDDPRLANVPDAIKVLILHGDNPAEPGKQQSRSEPLFAAVCGLVRADVPTELIYTIITDRDWKISTSVLEKKDVQRYAVRQIKNAKGAVAAECARANGKPLWKETADKHGLMPKASYRNARIAIQAMGVACRFDDFHKKILVGYEGDVPHDISPLVGEVSDAALARLRLLISERFDFDPGEKHVYDAVVSLAYENVFDPILDYLDELTWDGVPRLDAAAITYFGAPDTSLNRAFMRNMLLAAVRRARQPGCKFDQICVLEGVEGTNKSSAIQLLAGGRENFSDATILGADDKVVQENVAGVWLYEIADLSGISRAEVERVKAFASRDTDRARKAYGRVRENVPRRCVFFASTNDREYLKSKTGNRRFWPLPTTVIDIEALRRDRDQLWAEAASREAAGESIVLDESLWANAREEQEQRVESDPWDELLDGPEGAARVAEVKNGQQRVASSDLLETILKIEPGKRTTDHGRRLALAMNRLGWKRHASNLVWVDDRKARGFYREVRDAIPF